jgi:CRISPR/Cas system-associated exonuclease Cas4 (RecB family)
MASPKSLAKLVAEKSKKKTPAEDFLYMLEEATIRIASEERKAPSQFYKPSSLGGCLRNVFYQVTGAPSEKSESDESASSVGITQSGSDRHERIQKAVAEMKRLGYPVEWIDLEEYLASRPQSGTEIVEKKGMETKLFNKILKLSFLCDGIIRIRGVYYVLEVKTEIAMKWNGRTEPEDNHKTQGACYSATLGIDRVIFLYENRDMCKKKAILYVVSDEEKFERVIEPIEKVETHKKEGTLPEMTDKKKFCRYCAYQARCKRDGASGGKTL